MKKEKWQISVSLVCIILGMLLAVQFQTQQKIGEAVPTRRVEELAAMLKQEQELQKMLEIEENKLKKQLQVMPGGTNTKVMKDDIERNKILAGITSVKGPGVQVTLDDSTNPPKPGEDPNLYIIHNEDILKVVNELWAGGAEAMSVNNQRISATSEITCAGPTISINQTRLAPPYIITAIGNSNTLNTSLHLRGGIIEALQYFSKQYGIIVKIEKKEKITIPEYKGSRAFQYAKSEKVGE